MTPIAAGRRDVVVVGAGPAGMAAALSAAACGRRVTLVSDGQLLGDGLQGAYKSKAMWELARDRMTARRQGFGYAPAAAAVRFDEIHEQLECGVAELCEMYAHYLDVNHVELILARARFLDPHTIEAGRARIEADAFIVATGARPRGLPGVTIDGRAIMTTQHIVDVAENFEKLLIVGAGVSGCEFASIFAALGVDVTLLDSAPCLLNNEDADLSALIKTMRMLVGSFLDVVRDAVRRNARARVVDHHHDVEHAPQPVDEPAPRSSQRARSLRIFPYALRRDRVERAIRALQVPAAIVETAGDADVVLTLRAIAKKQPRRLREGFGGSARVHAVASSSPGKIEQALRELFDLELPHPDQHEALREAEGAVIEVIARRHPVELAPRDAYLRRLQHQLANAYGLQSQSVGREPFRHVLIRPAGA